MGDSRRVRVLLNEKSGGGGRPGRELAGEVTRLFAEAGWTAEVTLLTAEMEVGEVARRALEETDATIVAGGGDGTVSAVAAVLAGTDRALGVLPVGTLNHFAKDLGLPADVPGAVRVIAAGHTRMVDVGEANGRFFLNNSSMGLYPTIVAERTGLQRQHGLKKWTAVAVATARALVRFPRLEVELEANGSRTRCDTPLVFVGNNEYVLAGAEIGKRQRLDGGHLCVYMTTEKTRAGLLRLAFAAVAGRLKQRPQFQSLCVDEVTIRSRAGRLRVAFDGEVATLATPLEYRIRRQALRVIAPEGEEGGGAAGRDA